MAGRQEIQKANYKECAETTAARFLMIHRTFMYRQVSEDRDGRNNSDVSIGV